MKLVVLFFFVSLGVVSGRAQSNDFESYTTSSRLRSLAQSEITRAEWERQQLTSVIQVLQTLPAVQNAQSGVGQVAGVFVAGSASDQVLVLLDGMPLNDPTSPGGAFDFSRIPLSVLEKIEVIPQNEAVRFGFGALGGVILLTTREPRSGGLAQVFVDHQGDRDLALFFSDERNSILLSGARAESLSSASESKGNTEKDFSSSQEVLVQSQLGPRHRRLRFLQTRQQFESDNGPGANQDDPNSEGENVLRLVRFEDQIQTNVVSISPSLRWSQNHRQLENPSDAQFVDSSFARYKSESINFNSSFDFSSEGKIILLDYSAELQKATFEESYNASVLTDFESDQVAESLGLILGKAWSLQRFEFGYRQDLQGRDQKAAQLKMQTFLTRDLVFEFYFGRGVKTPTLYQKYSCFGSTDLRTEKSNSIRLSLSQKEKGLSVFQSDYLDLIQFSSSYINVGEARVRGVSTWFGFHLSEQEKLKLAIQYVDPQDRTRERKLLRRSEWTASANYSLELKDQSQLQADAQILGRADDQDAAGNSVERDTQILLGASRVWGPEEFKYGLRLDNLLDQRDSSVWGYTRAGLRLQASFLMKF